ncbi:hypothetical protein RJT34_11015 [Clitoria ternatea]|uniref:NB-ARC domain-containing protein n=1 Tax=Clitoria ternatea TaxID=43366 RepID=A0AAN9JLW6_CLITE
MVVLGGGQDASAVTTTDHRAGKFEAKFFDRILQEEIGGVKGHFGPINALAFNPDGKSFSSGGEDDIRHQRHSFGEAMIKHEDRFGKGSEKLMAWRYEINFIEKIAEKVHKNLAPKPIHIGDNLVGLEHHIQKVKLLLDMRHDDDKTEGIGHILDMTYDAYINVRHQKERYCEALIKHENKFGKDSQKVMAWRLALSKAANLPGKHISTGYEINFIEKIAEKVYNTIAPMKTNVESHVDKTVCMLGIYGLGGIGKTEFAKVLYDEIVHQFDAASFLGNVREKSNKINGLQDLQNTLLSDMREEVETELGNPSKGAYEIKPKLHQKQVLLILDDVDDI